MIETSRLILRPFTEEDAADAFEYLSGPLPNCFACMKLNSLSEAQTAMKKRAAETEYYFAIVLKETGKVIGEIDAYPESVSPDEASARDTFSPCWLLNRAFHGKGYAHEAAHAFFDYLFNQKDARRIYAYTEDDNLSSQRLCEKLGMRREGMFLEFVSFVPNPDGTPHYENTIQYAILKKEWEAIDRIRRMEACFDALSADLSAGRPVREELVHRLTDYYDNGLWMHDYQLDEQGLLPSGLKRGVLSEDGVYNLLADLADENTP